ncbi:MULTISPECIES: biotin carboxyl carrier protein [unclassified Sphingomonas]|uniref:biotin carboxyl carrier protein n=1 Tax=unclassified Sphingomonas TaxID=196159 RepID=UPI0006F9160C|nr:MULTISPECIES: biotin carboxyl carrier protein [unclassified Sphingomonas]KRB78786.1 biotin carboxyl carrier protein [Sphingomonas sp. Root710]KRB93696.1 biotin carboxyl carrier protein [Sphingomonas sp. Root720]
MAEIDLVDVSIRDGNQSLWGATGLATRQMLEIAGKLDRVGFRAIDFTSSSHMAVAVRYFRDNPWERIRRMRAAMPRTPLQFITTGLRFIAWEQADPDFMRIVYRRLQACGIRRFILLEPTHDAAAVIEAARIVKQEGGAETMAALTFTLSDVHDDAFYAGFAAKLAGNPDIDLFYVKDPSGLLSPERAGTLIPAIRAAIGRKRLEVHLHCTIGLGPRASLAAVEAGAEAVHVGIGPLGNGTSLPEAERMIANLREAGHLPKVDAAALASVAHYWRRLATAEGLPSGRPQEFDASFLRHQIAGGVMTTMLRQLTEVKLEHRLADVIAETEQVRAEFGQPIMVTPFPQMVCSQALFNVVAGRRYAQVSDQVIRYVMGRFGRPTRPVDAAVEAAILDRPRAREIEREPAVLALAEMRARFPGAMPEEEFLLRAVMPSDQVDAMLAAGPAKARYSPDAAPIVALLRQLAARPAARDLVVERPGLRLALHAGGAVG